MINPIATTITITATTTTTITTTKAVESSSTTAITVPIDPSTTATTTNSNMSPIPTTDPTKPAGKFSMYKYKATCLHCIILLQYHAQAMIATASTPVK